MASMNYTWIVTYSGNGDGATGGTDVPWVGTLTDNDTNSTFEAGDQSASGTAWGGNGAYLGTVTIDGLLWPVFYDSSVGESVVYMSQAPVSYPFVLEVEEGATYAACFLAGTGIATPGGDRAVEDLTIGDDILTAEGRAVPVKWIGRQRLLTMFGPAARLRPVRIRAGALGNGLPARDLLVTADHGILVDGVMCHAGVLVNGTTITRESLADMGESYTVYHIETEGHEVILAEGAPAETYVDNGARSAFDNYAEFLDLYGEPSEAADLPYPRAMTARQVPARIRTLLDSAIAA